MTWTNLRHVLPFLSGVSGSASVLIGLLIAYHSVPAAASRSWQFFTVQFLCVVVVVGGVLALLSTLEVHK